MLSIATSRLQKELISITRNFSEAFQVTVAEDDISKWTVEFSMPSDTVYAGEQYKLSFTFPHNYPLEAPEVVFAGTPPRHEHVYTNGFICLSTLYDGWTPALKVSDVTLSIISMLSSAKKKTLPKNNKWLTRRFRGVSPKVIDWEFEDDEC
jgi:ubiquitin-conjugating enzyme E2 W